MHGLELVIHWHGLHQRRTQYYDGVPYVTQCPIHEGNSFRYQFDTNAGTHFWHAHSGETLRADDDNDNNNNKITWKIESFVLKTKYPAVNVFSDSNIKIYTIRKPTVNSDQ